MTLKPTLCQMWTLFRQWRFVRWVNKELLRHEEQQDMTTYGSAMLLSVQAAITEYGSRMWVWASAVKIRQLLELCVDEGYLSTQQQKDIGLSVKVTPSKGGKFKPVISGLIFGELAAMGPVWAAASGGLVVGLFWVLHVIKVLW
jgi:hypothetical protein